MKVLIVAATKEEIQPVLDQLRFQWDIHKRLHKYLHKSTNVDVLITGVGMVSTAYWLGKTLAEHQYNCAINAGVAGCFYKDLPLGTVVNVERDSIAELGAEDGDQILNLEDMNLDSDPIMEVDTISNKTVWKLDFLKELPRVMGITVNRVHGNSDSISDILEKRNPTVESMEGAAFLYACKAADLDCIQLRALSNYVEPRDRSGWELDKAIRNLNLLVMKTIDAL